jgi:hypothetical protein
LAIEVIDDKRKVEATTMVEPLTLFHFHNNGNVASLILTDEGVEAMYKAYHNAKESRILTLKNLVNGPAT